MNGKSCHAPGQNWQISIIIAWIQSEMSKMCYAARGKGASGICFESNERFIMFEDMKSFGFTSLNSIDWNQKSKLSEAIY